MRKYESLLSLDCKTLVALMQLKDIVSGIYG
ncbi:hypothetical protein Tco_0096348, partial [Tanacetum coccineum]